MRYYAVLHNAQQAHGALTALFATLKPWLVAGHKFEVRVRDESRTLEQNSAQWPILEAFAKQLQWPVNAEMVYMTAEEWKDVLTAAFNREHVRIAKGLDGGVVMLGLRTSEFGKQRFSEWLEFLHATAAARGVNLEREQTGV